MGPKKIRSGSNPLPLGGNPDMPAKDGNTPKKDDTRAVAEGKSKSRSNNASKVSLRPQKQNKDRIAKRAH